MQQFDFQNPAEVGSSEYRAIYGCLESGLEDCPAEEQAELAVAMLEEFQEHAAAMLRKMNKNVSERQVRSVPPSELAADSVPADVAREIVAAIRQYMFLKNGRWQWRELSGADFIEFVTLLLSQHDLVPELADG